MSQDTLDGVLAKVLSHKPGRFNPAGTPFLVGRLDGGRVVMGEMLKPRNGEAYRFYGEYRPQKNYPEPAFFFTTFEVVIEQSENGITKYIYDYVDGIGRVKAAALVNAFGTDTLNVLRSDPDRAASVPGISETNVKAIRRHFDEEAPFDPAAYATLVDLFADHRMPRRVVTKLLEIFGSNAPQAIRDNPYLLLAMPRMGWMTVDSLATAKIGYDSAGIHRHAAAILEALDELALDGHTYGARGEVESAARQLLGGPVIAEAWSAVLATDKVVMNTDEFGGEVWALARLDSAERTIARRLQDLATYALPLPTGLDDGGLEGLQVDGLRMMETYGVSILAGSPGTGKSFSLTKAISSLVPTGKVMMIMAPTGKAAKRAAELLSHHLPGNTVQCSTVHKALGPKPSEAEVGVPQVEAKLGRGREEFAFGRGESDPLKVDVAVFDEVSMMDVSLTASALSAIPLGARVIFVGDPNQLPSVGPGSVLRDMLEANIPNTVLTEIRRNSGRIVRACHAIKDGIVPEPAGLVDLAAGENWVHIELSEPANILAEIVRRFEVVLAKSPNARTFDPIWDMQVVCPQIEKPAGICCRDINRALSPLLNPERGTTQDIRGGNGDGDSEANGFEPPFRPGDKIVRTKNGMVDELLPLTSTTAHADFRWRDQAYEVKEIPVVNGDLGQVLDIVPGPKGSSVVVKFLNPDRLCRLAYSECHLIQAYALTAHKCQGSGMPYVILPVHQSYFWDNRKLIGIWHRELIYTAFSRAEKLLVTIGQFSAIRQAVGRKTVHTRRTRLVERIKQVMGSQTITSITLINPSGKRLSGLYPALELAAKGIHEGDRFSLATIDEGDAVRFDIRPAPRRVLSPEELAAIRDEIERELDGYTPHDDY